MEAAVIAQKVQVYNATEIQLDFYVQYGESHAVYSIHPKNYGMFQSTINHGTQQSLDQVKTIMVQGTVYEQIRTERDFSQVSVPEGSILKLNLQWRDNNEEVLEWNSEDDLKSEESKSSFNVSQYLMKVPKKKKVLTIRIFDDSMKYPHDDSAVVEENNRRIRNLLNLTTNLRLNRGSVELIEFEGTLGGNYNPMRQFFDNFIIGSEPEKVVFFNHLANNNETLLKLIIKKKADIDEFNKIIDFLKEPEFKDEDWQNVLKSMLIPE